MQKFKIETILTSLQARSLGQSLASVPNVVSVDIDRRRQVIKIEGEAQIAEVASVAATQGVIITPL